MHSVELLEEAIQLAQRRGIVVRQDWFGGTTGGACQVKGRPWILIDLALSPREQLEQVLSALAELPNLIRPVASPQLRGLLDLRKAA